MYSTRVFHMCVKVSGCTLWKNKCCKTNIVPSSFVLEMCVPLSEVRDFSFFWGGYRSGPHTVGLFESVGYGWVGAISLSGGKGGRGI